MPSYFKVKSSYKFVSLQLFFSNKERFVQHQVNWLQLGCHQKNHESNVTNLKSIY